MVSTIICHFLEDIPSEPNSELKLVDVVAVCRNLYVFVLGHVLAEVGRTPGETEQHPEPSLAIKNLNQYPVLKKALAYKDSYNFTKVSNLA